MNFSNDKNFIDDEYKNLKLKYKNSRKMKLIYDVIDDANEIIMGYSCLLGKYYDDLIEILKKYENKLIVVPFRMHLYLDEFYQLGISYYSLDFGDSIYVNKLQELFYEEDGSAFEDLTSYLIDTYTYEELLGSKMEGYNTNFCMLFSPNNENNIIT